MAVNMQITRNIYIGENQSYKLSGDSSFNFQRRYFDARLYHILAVSSNKAQKGAVASEDGVTEFSYANNGNALYIYPYHTYGSFSGDYYETEDSITERIADLQTQLNAQNAVGSNDPSAKKVAEALSDTIANLEERRSMINDFNTHFKDQMLASHSLIHPYAIVKLSGAMGSQSTLEGSYLFDSFATRKWYEVDGDNISSYAKNPTTTKLIAWGNEDLEGRTPYSYQDFVFCKNWNVIPNNRMITLRRYFAPVTDNIEFDNYKEVGSLEDVLTISPDAAIGVNPGQRHLWADKPMEKIKNMGVEILYVTLHVGLGTFRPVQVDDVLEHKMHEEAYVVSKSVAERLNLAKKEGRRIISVGTTSTRTLESNYNNGFHEEAKTTSIFIYPGYEFKAIDCLITNFHLPKSTLIMLVSALAGKDNIMNAYSEAVKEKYRFFSFGDAMFIKED